MITNIRCFSRVLGLALLFGTGCATVPWSVTCKGDGWPSLPGEEPVAPSKAALPVLGSGGECYRYRIREKKPKTMLEWQLGEDKDKDEKHEEPGNGKEKKADGAKNGGDNKNGNGNGGKKLEIEYEEPLQTDRPDFGAATTNVGRGRLMLETGYDFLYDRRNGERTTAHSFPNALLHIGMFADWFEFRIGQNHANFRTTPVGGRLGGIGVPDSTTESGFQDLYLGVRLALTEQKKFLPESVLIVQSTVPSGSRDLTAGRILPGVIYLFSWDLGESPWSLSGLFEVDRAVDDSRHYYTQFAQTMEVKYQATKRLSFFAEFLALYPSGARNSDIGPQFYVNPGFVYWISNNVQLDAHLFVGLNRGAVQYFGGPGLSFRY